MSVATLVKPGLYRDSVALLELTRALRATAGVQEAAALMATPANRELLVQSGLWSPEAQEAGPNDLVIAVRAESAPARERALAMGETFFAARPGRSDRGGRHAPRTIESACRALPGATLALISVPGAFAAGLARRALGRGLSAMLFSDNVSLADEVALKRRALAHGLLLLGPDCGTAYLGGVGLGFANAVPRGRVGVVAASGTGLQQLAVLLAARGEGLSHGIGVGGRDMTEAVGGLMTLAGLDALAIDPATELIAVVGKPPSAAVRREVEARLADCGKPSVTVLIGADPRPRARDRGILTVSTIEDAADAAVAALAGHPWTPQPFAMPGDELAARIENARRGRAPGQVAIHGLYAGGTLAHEAIGILEALLGPVDGNLAPTPRPGALHRVVDLGADDLTVGRAHPMLDGRLRAAEIERAGHDPRVAVLLLDLVLGHGAAADPAGDIAPALVAARARAGADGRSLSVVASVVGAAGDPQGLAAQTARLEAAGAWVLPSNAQAARAAACLAGGPATLAALLDPQAAPALDAGGPARTTRRAGAAPIPSLGRELRVVNVGLEAFADDLDRRGVAVAHVAWAPPAGGDPRKAALLDLLEDADG